MGERERERSKREKLMVGERERSEIIKCMYITLIVGNWVCWFIFSIILYPNYLKFHIYFL